MNRAWVEFLIFLTIWIAIGGVVVLILNGRIQPHLSRRQSAQCRCNEQQACCSEVPCSKACAYWHKAVQDLIDSVGGVPGGDGRELEDHPADLS